ncbi:MAG: hypothetical protein KIT58_00860 [Planctomycetota bacterium]|nr:hypothetical protein [Planctomycetota bacterium]
MSPEEIKAEMERLRSSWDEVDEEDSYLFLLQLSEDPYAWEHLDPEEDTEVDSPHSALVHLSDRHPDLYLEPVTIGTLLRSGVPSGAAQDPTEALRACERLLRPCEATAEAPTFDVFVTAERGPPQQLFWRAVERGNPLAGAEQSAVEGWALVLGADNLILPFGPSGHVGLELGEHTTLFPVRLRKGEITVHLQPAED